MAVTHLCNSAWCSGSCSSCVVYLTHLLSDQVKEFVKFLEISLVWLCPLYKWPWEGCSHHQVPVYSGTWAVAGSASPGLRGHLVHTPLLSPQLATLGARIPVLRGKTAPAALPWRLLAGVTAGLMSSMELHTLLDFLSPQQSILTHIQAICIQL